MIGSLFGITMMISGPIIIKKAFNPIPEKYEGVRECLQHIRDANAAIKILKQEKTDHFPKKQKDFEDIKEAWCQNSPGMTKEKAHEELNKPKMFNWEKERIPKIDKEIEEHNQTLNTRKRWLKKFTCEILEQSIILISGVALTILGVNQILGSK